MDRWAALGAFALASAAELAWACPSCAANNRGGGLFWWFFGGMLLVPFLIVGVGSLVIRKIQATPPVEVEAPPVPTPGR